MRLLYDSTSAADIPASAEMVAGYMDGLFRWSDADWLRFPRAIKIGIAISPQTSAGTVLDVERGDATPQEAPGWAHRCRAAGGVPTIYCGLSAWAEVRAAFIAESEPEPNYWIASYDGVAELIAGEVAKQYANEPLSGGHFDLSVVADHWPGVDPSSEPAKEKPAMRVISDISNGRCYVTGVGPAPIYIPQGDELADLIRTSGQKPNTDGTDANGIFVLGHDTCVMIGCPE